VATPGSTAKRKSKTKHAEAVAWWYHVLLALIVASISWLANSDPSWYESLMQEDRLVEWGTVFFFFAAAVMGGLRAYAGRRLFDGLVAAFCFFVAGEEFSWGQRLLGFTAPSYFLENNRQQEFTLHNFADIFGQPKWVLIIALTGYGVALPLVALSRLGRKYLERVRATPPPLLLAPWFGLAVLLLLWYPLDFTGEWVELIAGMLFAMALSSGPYLFATLSLNAVLFSALLTWWSGRSLSRPEVTACAREESAALVDAFAQQQRLVDAIHSFHKRVWTAHEEARVDYLSARPRLTAAPCHEGDHAARRQYAIDPWGTAYWIRFDVESDDLVVYSFGPNRRRDDGGDDIVSAKTLTTTP
jgi:hypothetical protein